MSMRDYNGGGDEDDKYSPLPSGWWIGAGLFLAALLVIAFYIGRVSV